MGYEDGRQIMSERAIVEKIQEVIQGLPEFEAADVVINDWRIFDRPNIEAPYVLLETSDDFDSQQIVRTPEQIWGIPITLVENFIDWQETYDNFMNRRQAIIDAFNGTNDARSASGLNIYRIRNEGAITPFYDKMIPADLQPEALPVFIMQRIILEAKEF